jgi:hypothetical protein
LLALCLTSALFVFWTALGYAVLRIVKVDLDPLQELLLSPVVGVVATCIPLFLINGAGVPVVRFATPLTVALLIFAAVPLMVGRRALPLREWRPFGLVLLGALLVIGWPLLQYGFDWLSLCNDDMANYCLGAGRFLRYGFFDVPSARQLIEGRDYTQFYWFLHVPMMVRPGIELMLAWVIALTQLTPHEIFMPTTLAFHLCQISALAALVAQTPKLRAPAAWACALLALSALATFGALYQLVAQVFGMGLLAATCVILMRPFPTDGALGPVLRRAALAGFMGAGLLLMYPEVSPIVGASWLLFLAGEVVRRRVRVKPLATFAVPALVLALVLLGRRHVVGITGFLLYQAHAGSGGDIEAGFFFPFYRLPSGVADFWGFFPLAFVPYDPYSSILIAWGALLLVIAAIACVWLALRHHPVAIVASVMLALTAFLLTRGAYFGLYKIAMYMQPFVLGSLAVAAYAWFRRPWARTTALALVALGGLTVQQTYVRDSRGTGAAGGFPEIADPSGSRINAQFRDLLAANRDAAAAAGLVCDTPNIVLAKFQAYYTYGYSTVFTGSQVGRSIQFFVHMKGLAPQAILEAAAQLRDEMKLRLPRHDFRMHDPKDPSLVNEFQYPELGPLAAPSPTTRPTAEVPQPRPSPVLISGGPEQSVLNRWAARARDGAAADRRDLVAQPFDKARNHLMFIESRLGRSYFLGLQNVAMYQMEPDTIFYKGDSMAGIGRRFLFQVLRPSPDMRLVVELSSSLTADADNHIPDATVIGEKRQPVGFAGRGSARIFTPPVEPQVIDGRAFVGLDLGREPQPFRQERTGLMRLFNTDGSLDRRLLVCFARNISAVSPAQYAAMKPPSQIERFPKDLQNPHLEYTGWYEDGWVAEHAWAGLTRPWDAQAVVVKGWVPELADPSFRTELTVLVDGAEVARQTLGLKAFEVRAPLPPRPPSAAPPGALPGAPASRAKVELKFSRLQHLPLKDKRPVSMLTTFVGFEAPPGPPVGVQNFPADVDGKPLLAADGLYPDGWAAPRTAMRLSQPPDHGFLSLRGEVPLIGDGNFASELSVRVDGTEVARQPLKPGTFEVAAPVPPGGPSAPAAGRQVELEFTRAQQLPAGDGRAVGARLSFIGFVPTPLPPQRLEKFPDDLRKPVVQAQGVYDDGWVGETASFRLAQPPEVDSIHVAGMVPKIGDADGFTTDLTVTLDGKEVGRRTIGLDRFEVDLPVPPPATSRGEARQVQVRFSRTQTLPLPDGRVVGARLSSVGFSSAP